MCCIVCDYVFECKRKILDCINTLLFSAYFHSQLILPIFNVLFLAYSYQLIIFSFNISLSIFQRQEKYRKGKGI